jgi:uncharacterized membrane protein/mono/diheme cytochrome c family protein
MAIIVASIVTVIMLCLAMFTDGIENAPEWTLFLGHFHPALLHLPIGFYTVLAVLEYLDSSKSGPRIGKACEIVLNYTAIVAVIAAVLGILLALPGGYNETLLDRHRWLGSLSAIFAFWLIVLRNWARSKSRNGFSIPYHSALAATLILLVVVGHDGGTLTHGSGYLTKHLPSPLKSLFGMEGADDKEEGPLSVEDADVYQDIIHPIFDQTCIQCHGPDKSKGELRLDSFELAMLGGELGDTIIPGDSEASELIYRLHLEIDDDERMPPEGKPQPTEGQIAILEWWIQAGAMESGLVGELEIPETVRSAMVAHLEGSAEVEEKEEIPEILVPMLAWEEVEAEIATIEEEPNIDILRVALNSPAVRVKGPFGDNKFNDDALSKLEPIANNIVELEIGFSDVTDEGLAAVAKMSNLEKLYLQKTSVTDEGIQHLEGLTRLRYLNLYGTQVTDDALDTLVDLPRLKSLFVWETQISKSAAEDFQERKLEATGVKAWQEEIDALKAKISDAKILVDTGIETAN